MVVDPRCWGTDLFRSKIDGKPGKRPMLGALGGAKNLTQDVGRVCGLPPSTFWRGCRSKTHWDEQFSTTSILESKSVFCGTHMPLYDGWSDTDSSWPASTLHQEFQVPKMEVLNLIRPFWGWAFPYKSLTYSLYRWVPPFSVPEMSGEPCNSL